MRSAIAAGAFLIALITVLRADDPKETPKTAPAKDFAPDWSKFVTTGEIAGEIVKADESGFTLRVTWYAPKGGGNGQRPSLGGGGSYKKQGGSRPPQMQEQHHDYVLKFAEQGLVRQVKMPEKKDDKGKKIDYTPKELDTAKKPYGAPNYAAERKDLSPGDQVEVMLVRSRDIPAAKATEADLQVKYAIIHVNGSKTATPDPKKK